MQSGDLKDLKQSGSISQNPLRSQLNCARATAYDLSSKLHKVLIDGFKRNRKIQMACFTMTGYRIIIYNIFVYI